MNKQLKEKTQKLIMANHKHFAMPDWTTGFNYFDIIDIEKMVHSCGTTGCLGAWTVLAAGLKIKQNELIHGDGDQWNAHIEVRARQLLGLESHRVFHLINWPDPLYDQYEEARFNNNTIGMAEVACAALDYFMDREGKG